jgi:putative transcriptional regulator
MSYTPIAIDRDALTIMGVPFPDLKVLDSTAAAIGTNMFEGYQPTKKGVEIIRDYILGKITFKDVVRAAVDESYVE